MSATTATRDLVLNTRTRRDKMHTIHWKGFVCVRLGGLVLKCVDALVTRAIAIEADGMEMGAMRGIFCMGS